MNLCRSPGSACGCACGCASLCSTSIASSGVCSLHGGYVGTSCPMCSSTVPGTVPGVIGGLPANGWCSEHGWWWGYGGCPTCAHPFLAAPAPTIVVAPIPEGYRLVPEATLRRIWELVDEFVELATELAPGE